MKDNKDIFADITKNCGMTVPDGYFESFAEKMTASLPYREEAEHSGAVILPSPTLWTRIRPYVYLAAMFAGVWCMLKMFVLMSSPTEGNYNVDRNPILAEALKSDGFIDEYVIDDLNQWDLLDEMMEEGFDAASLQLPPDSDTDVHFIDPAAVQTQDF